MLPLLPLLPLLVFTTEPPLNLSNNSSIRRGQGCRQSLAHPRVVGVGRIGDDLLYHSCVEDAPVLP